MQSSPESGFKVTRETVQETYEKIDKKIDCIQEFQTFVLDDDRLDSLTAEDFQAELEKIYQDKIVSDPENKKTLELYQKIEYLLIAIEEIKQERASLKEKRPLDDSEVLSFRDKINSLKSEINTIQSEEGPDIEYIFRIKKYIKYLVGLKQKRDKLKAIYDKDEDHQAFRDYIQEYFAHHYQKYREAMLKKHGGNFKGRNLGTSAYYGQYVKDVQFRGLATLIMFDNKAKNLRDFNSVLGRAYRYDGLCLYFEKSKKHTPEHEYNHILYGALGSHTAIYHDRFVSHINNLVKADRLNEITEGKPTEILLSERIKKYHLYLMGEIFADFDSIFEHNLIDGFYSHYTNTSHQLHDYAESLGSEHKYYSVISDSITELDKNVFEMIEQYQELVFYSKQLNVIDEAKAAVVLFGGDPRKALRHLKHKYKSQLDKLPEYDPDDRGNEIFKYEEMRQNFKNKQDN